MGAGREALEEAGEPATGRERHSVVVSFGAGASIAALSTCQKLVSHRKMYAAACVAAGKWPRKKISRQTDAFCFVAVKSN